MALQSTRQFHASKVSHANSSTGQGTDDAVHQCTESQMSSDTCPSTGQLCVGIPSHAELQRQCVSNDNSGGRLARNTVGSCSSNRSRRNRLGRSVHQHIHARSDVQVAELQRTSQSDHHGRVDLAQAALAIGVFRCSLLKLFFAGAGRERLRWDAAGQWRIIVDVEFQQMEERVVDKVNRAVDILFYAKEELERAAGFIAGRERDIGQLASSVGNVFAGVASTMSISL